MEPTRKFTAAALVSGRRYRVIAPFRDFDGEMHSVGETWLYLRNSFFPYDDGLSLFVERDGREEQIRLQWRPEAQAEVIERFHQRVEEL